VTEAGWLLVGLVLGVLLTVGIVEWHDRHARRVARLATRRTDAP
jgi:hypothetical protein